MDPLCSEPDKETSGAASFAGSDQSNLGRFYFQSMCSTVNVRYEIFFFEHQRFLVDALASDCHRVAREPSDALAFGVMVALGCG